MTLPRSAADVLADHVLFEIEAIDRMYLNLDQPRLQHGAGIAAFGKGREDDLTREYLRQETTINLAAEPTQHRPQRSSDDHPRCHRDGCHDPHVRAD